MEDSIKMANNKPIPLFRLERKGQFQFDSYCWTDGPKTLHFEIEITTRQLDKEGFVFDNRAIERYFEENFQGKTEKVSCERIAEQILYYLCEKLPDCQGCTVKVSGSPDVTWLSASFEREEVEELTQVVGA